ncbi:MAG: ribonuclease Z [Candidatus Omnitrophica bacterium]|nr:ribonuclease Z [Candidatus Omnitrophota bacterium]HOX55141.1 ribonuclease Z [Candidatus Omnitrophota bacterium]
MKVIFLGTNGWYDTKTGNTICILVQTGKGHIVFDAGNGIYKLDRYIKDNKPIYIFLSHFHLDHIAGLHILAKFRFSQGITIMVPSLKSPLLKKIINYPYSIPFKKLKIPVKVKEFCPNSLPFDIKSFKLRHSTFVHGYRLTSKGRTVAYAADTGICPNLYRLAENADLLIAECAYRPGQQANSWPHLNPESAARVAKKANAKKLALIHFDAYYYPNLKKRILAENCAKKIFFNTISTKDEMMLRV